MNAVVFEEDSVETAVLSSDEMAVVENVNVPPWLANRIQQRSAAPNHPPSPQPALPATAPAMPAVIPGVTPAAAPAPSPRADRGD